MHGTHNRIRKYLQNPVEASVSGDERIQWARRSCNRWWFKLLLTIAIWGSANWQIFRNIFNRWSVDDAGNIKFGEDSE